MYYYFFLLSPFNNITRCQLYYRFDKRAHKMFLPNTNIWWCTKSNVICARMLACIFKFFLARTQNAMAQILHIRTWTNIHLSLCDVLYIRANTTYICGLWIHYHHSSYEVRRRGKYVFSLDWKCSRRIFIYFRITGDIIQFYRYSIYRWQKIIRVHLYHETKYSQKFKTNPIFKFSWLWCPKMHLEPKIYLSIYNYNNKIHLFRFLQWHSMMWF